MTAEAGTKRTRCNAVLLTARGKTQTVAEWARETGKAPGTLYLRKKLGWPDELIVEDKTNARTFSARMVTAWGRTQTAAQWARETKIRRGTIHQRLDKQKWTPEQALGTPVRLRSAPRERSQPPPA